MPIDFMKTTMQCSTGNASMYAVATEALKARGPLGLFAGMGPRVAQTTIMSAAFFGLFEFWKLQLKPASQRPANDRDVIPKLLTKRRDHVWKRQLRSCTLAVVTFTGDIHMLASTDRLSAEMIGFDDEEVIVSRLPVRPDRTLAELWCKPRLIHGGQTKNNKLWLAVRANDFVVDQQLHACKLLVMFVSSIRQGNFVTISPSKENKTKKARHKYISMRVLE
eukprot:scaffold122836_cov47-Prasinocladus_malaysianus.AAC.1